MLACLTREIHLHQHLQAPGDGRGSGVHALKQVDAVNGMNQRHTLGRFSCFVRLQMPDEMPADLHIGTGIDLLQGLLNAVLAKIALARFIGGAHRVDGKCLGNGDETDVGGNTTRARRGLGDTRADLRKACCYRIHFFSCASMPFA